MTHGAGALVKTATIGRVCGGNRFRGKQRTICLEGLVVVRGAFVDGPPYFYKPAPHNAPQLPRDIRGHFLPRDIARLNGLCEHPAVGGSRRQRLKRRTLLGGVECRVFFHQYGAEAFLIKGRHRSNSVDPKCGVANKRRYLGNEPLMLRLDKAVQCAAAEVQIQRFIPEHIKKRCPCTRIPENLCNLKG